MSSDEGACLIYIFFMWRVRGNGFHHEALVHVNAGP